MITLVGDQSFNSWLANAQPGEKVCYYEGFLLIDRFNHASLPRQRLNDLHRAGCAMEAASAKLVYLFQRRTSIDYLYIAVKK